MKKNRILWCIWLILIALIFAFFKNSLALRILIISVVLPLGSFAVSLLGAGSIETVITGPEMLTKNESGDIDVTFRKSGFGKLTTARCLIEEHNAFTDEKILLEHDISNFTEEICWKHCGKIETRVARLKIMDLWGIFSYCKKSGAVCFTDVIPDFFIQEIATSKAASFDMESLEYSTQKPGEDPSEIFDIREYEYGDSLKRIHWKLTSKYDEIMVMRPSLPIDRSIILYLDLATEDEKKYTPQILDALCEVFTSISRNLIVQEMKHQICLHDEETGHLFVYSIEEQQDFAVALSKILGCRVRRKAESDDTLFMKYMKAPENLPYAHNVICTLNEQPEDDIYGGLCMTTLIPSAEYSCYEESMVSKQIKFSEGYAEELFHIVI